MADIEFMKEVVSLGKEIGLKDEELQEFVKVRLEEKKGETEKTLEAEEKKRQSEERKMDRQIAAEAQKRKDEMEAEGKRRVDELERETRAEERAIEKVRIQASIEEKRLELDAATAQVQAANTSLNTTADFKGRKHQKLDHFDPKKDDLDAYITRFEAYATNCEWPADSWAMNLGLSLKGEALVVYSAQSPEDRQNYTNSKTALMKAFNLTEEGFRKKFLSCKPAGSDTWQTYQSRISNLLNRWIDMSGIKKSYEELLDLLRREQIISVFQEDLRVFIRERQPKSTEEIIKIAESFREARYCTAYDLCVYDTSKIKSTGSFRKFPKYSYSEQPGKYTKPIKNGNGKSTQSEPIAGAGLFNPGKSDSKPRTSKGGKFQPKPTQDQQSAKPGKQNSNPGSGRKCFNCFSKDHVVKDCPKPLRAALAVEEESSDDEEIQLHQEEETDSGEESAACITVDSLEPEVVITCTCAAVNPLKNYPAKVNGKDCTSIRDTGLTSMVVRESFVKPEQYTGKKIKCRLMDNSIILAPEVVIEVDSIFYKGLARAMAMKNPISDLAIGNIANVLDFDTKNLVSVPRKSKVQEKKTTSTKLKIEEKTKDHSSKKVPSKIHKSRPKENQRANAMVDNPDLFSSDVFPFSSEEEIDAGTSISLEENHLKNTNPTTESESKENQDSKSESTDTSSTDPFPKEETPKSTEQPQEAQAVVTRNQEKSAKKPTKPLKVTSKIKDVSPAQFRKEQENDPTLQLWWNFAKKEKKFSSKTGKVTWKIDDGLLYRIFTEPKQLERTFHQLAVPSSQRMNILKLAHDTIFGGHLGIRKTTQKVKAQFCWPGIDKSIKLYIRSCDRCQKFEPKGRTPRAYLNPMPIVDQPFRKIAIDLVGPLKPMTERGHQYILTIMDYATRYPEAFPLKKIDTETVAETLLEVYSRFGIPEEILSDLGTQFTSDVMNEVSRLLSIRQLTTSAYHAMGNGMVEKFNGTLKTILKKLCKERPKDWDRYITPLLFAYREAPHCSGGFSPFDMLYGWPVRGLLETVKDLWTDPTKEPEVQSSYRYVLDLRERLKSTCDFVKQNIQAAQDKYKHYYDKKAKVRSLQVGDLVLLLLPTESSKLLMSWRGPYKIVNKIGQLDYKVDLDGRLQTFHINMLKRYYARTTDVLAQIMQKPTGRREDDETVDHDSDQATALVAIESVIGATCVGIVDDATDAIPTAVVPNETLKDINIYEKLKDGQIKQLWSLLCDHESMFSDIPSRTTLLAHDIKLTSEKPFRKRQYPIPFSLIDKVKSEVETMLKMDIIEPSTSPYSSPYLMIQKPDKSTRFCVDLRAINAITEFDAEPMPDVDLMFTKFQGSNYFSELDMTKGYWQIPLSEQAKPCTAFATPLGHFQFKVMPFGCQGGPSSFSRLMRRTLGEIEGCQNFLDNIVIATKTWDEHIATMKVVLEKLQKANLRLRPSKCHIGYKEIQCLGYMVDGNNLWPIKSKIEPVEKFQPPKTKKLMKSFLGFTGFYQKFIPRYSDLTAPLSDKTKKNFPNEIRWEPTDLQCFQELKKSMMNEPILVLPDFKKKFYLATDASGTALGAVLLQLHDDLLRPIAYASKKLNDAETRYSTIERECLAIVWAISKFCRYLYGRKFVILTDHKPLQFLKTSKQVNNRLMRWSLVLQPYDFEIRAIKGTENLGPDFLSRMYDKE